MRSGRSLLLAIIASLLLHTTALILVHIPEGQAVTEEAPIEVALLPPPQAPSANAPPAQLPPAAPAQQPQMVAPPDQINDRAPDHTRFESDRDNTVLKETVNPGVPHPAAPVPAQAPQPPQAPHKAEAARDRQRAEARDNADDDAAAKAKQARRPAPALEDLLVPTDELVRAQRAEDRAAEAKRTADDEKPAAAGRRRLALAVPPVAPEWSLPGRRGTFDYLPDIQRGDVTLLNTKANVFAPFVRRIGERVFQHLILRQRALQLQQILTAHDVVEMRVVLDRGGKLKSVRVDNHSGSASMDDTLSEAINTAAFDNNPPPAAANATGEYEFVLAAQLRTFEPGQGGTPSRIESRLSVGLL